MSQQDASQQDVPQWDSLMHFIASQSALWHLIQVRTLIQKGCEAGQAGRQGSGGTRRGGSHGEAGWPKAAWYLKGMGRCADLHI